MARARAVRMATGTVTTAVGMGVGVVYMAGSVPFPVAPMRADVVPSPWVAYAAGRGSVARVGPSSHPPSGLAQRGQASGAMGLGIAVRTNERVRRSLGKRTVASAQRWRGAREVPYSVAPSRHA